MKVFELVDRLPWNLGMSILITFDICIDILNSFDSFVAGVILRERIPGFERMLWRTCHGNVFLKQAPIENPLEDPHSGDNVYKSVFIIFFQGEQLQSKVKKICEG